MNVQVTAQQQQAALVQANNSARALIIGRGLYRKNTIFTQTFNPANIPVLNIQPQYVGLIHGFLVQVKATLAPTAGVATLTEFGPANLLSQVVFNDLNNNVRVQTTGWHLHMLASAKKRWPYGQARAGSGYPVDFGNNWTQNFTAPQTINGATTVFFTYWVPLAYTQFDLRGAMFAGVVNATANLQLTPNPTPFAAAGDATLAVYSGQAGSISSMTVNVIQYYYDQLPIDQKSGAPILPYLDLGTIYDIKNTTTPTGITANQEYPIPYSNFRDFLSTVAIFDNGGVLNTGSDVSYWKLQSANFTTIWQLPPEIVALEAREMMGDDPPKGTYYFDSRLKPLSTVQAGNLQLILNASSASASAVVMLGYEAFAQVNTLVGAASLSPGA